MIWFVHAKQLDADPHFQQILHIHCILVFDI
jgi:hypothetical protein